MALAVASAVAVAAGAGAVRVAVAVALLSSAQHSRRFSASRQYIPECSPTPATPCASNTLSPAIVEVTTVKPATPSRHMQRTVRGESNIRITANHYAANWVLTARQAARFSASSRKMRSLNPQHVAAEMNAFQPERSFNQIANASEYRV